MHAQFDVVSDEPFKNVELPPSVPET